MIGFRTLFYKEVLRFWKVATQTLTAPIVTAMLYLLIFGQVLEGRVTVFGSVGYTSFLVPGLVMMSVLQNAFANSSSSLIQSKITGNLVFLLVARAAQPFTTPFAPQIPKDTILPLLAVLPSSAAELGQHGLRVLAPLMLTLLVLCLAIFSAFMLYDIKRVVDGGETNYISATLAIYLDLYNVFQSLLALLGIAGGERDVVADAADRVGLQIARSGRHIGQEAIQLHGGIGMTAEYAVGVRTAHLEVLDQWLGNGPHHLRRLSERVTDHDLVEAL